MSRAIRTKAERKSPEERSAEIATAARALALESGIAAVTLRGVAARVGVVPALVAHYQPSMDSLVASTFDSIVTAELEEIRELLIAASDPRAQISTLIGTLLDHDREDVTVVWVEAWGIGRRNELLAVSMRNAMDAWHVVVRGVIEGGVASGDFVTDDVDGIAWQLLGMIDGLNAQALVRWGEVAARGTLIGHAVEGMLGLQRGALS
jgi:AcrR family transcriptional regulator